jgi:hypothetical protein
MNEVIFNGSGNIIISGNITNWSKTSAWNNANVIAIAGGGLKK